MTVETLTPTIKGRLTKTLNNLKRNGATAATIYMTVSNIFRSVMPREQAKHQTRRYLARVAA